MNTTERKSFWNDNHELTGIHDRIWDEYVPDQGSTKYIETELFLASNRLMYDYYNNGWGCNNKTPELHLLQSFGYFWEISDEMLVEGLEILGQSENTEEYMDDEHAKIIKLVRGREKEGRLTYLPEDQSVFSRNWGLSDQDWDDLCRANDEDDWDIDLSEEEEE